MATPPPFDRHSSSCSPYATATHTSSHARKFSDKNKFAYSNKSSTASTSSNVKPLNIFCVWYAGLCRRQNTNPICVVRSQNQKNDQVLEFVADRIKIEDWQPVINALRFDTSLHVISIQSCLATHKVIEEADTVEKVKRIKKCFGAICTKYILKNLLEAIGNCLELSTVLTCLELDGLHIMGEYLQMVLKSLTTNKSLKYLSFKSCPVEDDGCFEICKTLHFLPNIEVLNLSNCKLGPKSGEHLAKLIKFQQINRYRESWQSSLRYEDPNVSNMAGLKRITINNNPNMSDEGLEYILNELVDDLWIKAIDMQRCNISEVLGGKIIDVIEYSKSLEIADFRSNNLDPSTIERILDILKCKQSDETNTQYQWCYSSTTLNTSTYGTYTSLLNCKLVPKSKKILKNNKITYKRQTVLPQIQNKIANNHRKVKEIKKQVCKMAESDNTSNIKTKDQLLQLYEKLKEEIAKRQETEKKCEELQKQVDELNYQKKNQMILTEYGNMTQYIIYIVSYFHIQSIYILCRLISLVTANSIAKEHSTFIKELQNALNKLNILSEPYETPHQFLEDINLSKRSLESLTHNKPKEQIEELCSKSEQKVQNIFQSMVGLSDDECTENVPDSALELNLASLDCNQELILVENISDRPTESAGEEKFSHLLEELSHCDMCENNPRQKFI